MNNNGKPLIRKGLKSERAATLRQIAALDDFRENYPGADFEVHLALRQEFYKKIEQIDAALERLQDGQYGLCEICGQPIDPNRLAIWPQATACVECQVKREIRRGALCSPDSQLPITERVSSFHRRCVDDVKPVIG